MGAFDTRLLHVQFLLFLVAALLALFALLRDRVPSLVLWLSLFALALAPAPFDQLLTAYADVPLALVFGAASGPPGGGGTRTNGGPSRRARFGSPARWPP